MPALVLGPILRHAGPDGATVWVETDAPCRVDVLSGSARTFAVAGRHYAVVPVEGFASEGAPYGVALDGAPVWPCPEGRWNRPGVLRPAPAGPRARIAVGSCRVAASHAPPATASHAPPPRGHGPDALAALARRLAGASRRSWPDLLLLLGDQVYVDHPSAPPPRDFAGHAEVYRRAWSEPAVRWLLSVVPSAMIADDHDVRDGWNGSPAADARRRGGAEAEPVAVALAAYWVYQHLGNLSAAQLDGDGLLALVRAERDGLDVLLRAARTWARGEAPLAHARPVGPARLVVMDARGRRVTGPGRRAMLDAEGWRWLDRELRGDAGHLLLASSVPVYMDPGLHALEAWAAAVADGAWGRTAARLAARLRRGLGLEHWPAYGDALLRLGAMLAEVARGARGAAPASVVVLSGEVHHGSLRRVALPAAGPCPVWQVVSSPLRNPVGARQRALLRVAGSLPFRTAMRAAAHMAGVRGQAPGTRAHGPRVFANHVAVLDLDGRSARLRLDAAVAGTVAEPELRTVIDHRLA